jgi:monomeric sarcosine oxidase
MTLPADTAPYDIIVLGAGIAGASAAEVLVRRGQRVLLVERFAAAHDGGSSHGDGRIIRYSYPEPVYVAMARRAYGAWAALEAAVGESLVERTGSWECGPPGSQQLADLEASFRRDGIVYEHLNAAQSAQRFPHFRLPESSSVLYQEEGGIVRAERAVLALLRLAQRGGAELALGEGAGWIHPEGDGVSVEGLRGTRWRARVVVVAAGGWTAPLVAPLGLELPLTVTREQVSYFPVRPGVDLDFGIGGMPTLIDYHNADQPMYSLPRIDVPGVKLGWHHSGPEVVPGAQSETTVDQEILRRQQDYVREHLPGLDPEPIQISRCLYTNTPDYHFILDRHPALPQVVIGTGFSGHGFKFGPVIGEILADLALGKEPPVDLATFSLSRFAREGLQRRRSA